MVKVIFIFGLILRLLLPMQRVFNFDQDQIALNAFSIAHGNLTVLGPQTSNASFFTGPLIYYLAAVFYRLTDFHPLANALTALAIYVFSFILINYFFKKLFPGKLTAAYLGIYAFSPYLVQLSRTTWNPAFGFLSGSLVLASLLKTNYPAMWLGMFLAYQSSFAGFILPLILILYGLWQRKKIKLVLTGFLGLAVSMLPLAIFDLKHNFMNLSGLIDFVRGTGTEAGQTLLTGLKEVIVINFENLTKLIAAYFFPRLVLVLLGIMIFIYWWRRPGSFFNHKQKQVVILWMTIFPLSALFYHSGLPEYYFTMQLPAFVFMLGDILIKVKKQTLGFFTVLTVISLGVVFTQNNGYTLKDKFAAIQDIKKSVGNQPVELIFDIDHSEQFGWEYLTKYFQINRVPQGEPVHLIFPVLSTTIFSERFGNIGVLYEP